MSGITQALDLKSEQGYCSIIPDCNGVIAKWVCDGLGYDTNWIGDNYTIGIKNKKNIIAGLIFNNYRDNVEVWLTIYSVSPYWCNKKILRYIFKTCFETLKCERVSVLVSKDNSKSLSLCKRLGFKIEGLLRRYRENGKDCYIMGMLKEENKWS